jgi:hypothetical protein
MTTTHADQVIYYAQSIAQLVESAQTAYQQFQTALRMEQRALKNLKGITDVNSWDDFMDWYNRQLYLERQTENRFLSLGVSIGGKKYRLKDIEEIPNAAKTQYYDYWGEDLSEKQKKEVWTTLGLTPANYAYVQTWETREKDLMKKLLIKKYSVNEENMRALERSNEMLNSIAGDRDKSEDEKMGEKELLSMIAELLIDNNRVVRQQAYDNAEAEEHRITAERAAKVPQARTDLSETWGEDFFGPIE